MNPVCSLFVFITMLITIPVHASSQLAQQGNISLNTEKFKQTGLATLDGEWGFYWGQLLMPHELKKSTKPSTFMSIPGLWNHDAIQGQNFKKFGFATVTLTLDLPPGQHYYFLKMPSLPSAYTLWANGAQVAKQGEVAKNKSSEIPWVSPRVIPIYAENSSLQLILQLSNFHHKEGGIWRSIVLASPDNLFVIRDFPVITDAILFSVLLTIGLYFLMLYLTRNKEKAALYFALFCLVVAGRSALVGEKILYGLDFGISWPVLHMVEYQLFFLSVPVFAWFFYQFYQHQVSVWLPLFCSAIAGIAFISTLLLPIHIYALLTVPYQVFGLLMAAPFSYYLFKLVAKKEEGAVLFSISFLLLILMSLHDVLYSHFVLPGPPLVQLGVIAFVISQSLVLNRRYGKSLSLVEAMAQELKSHNDELLKLDQLKDEFLAHTSHELRTPIHGIAGLADALLKNDSHQLAPLQSHQLNLIQSSAQRLGFLINDILDFSVLKHQKLALNISEVNLTTALSVSMRVLEPLLVNKPVTFKSYIPDDLPNVKADEHRLQQILFNLLGNAVKFTLRGEINIKVTRQDDCLEICIEDSGPGIKEELDNILFKPFSRLDSHASGHEQGSGLGLGITQNLLALHNSQLFIHSEEGKGTQVRFKLPICGEALVHQAQLLTPQPPLMKNQASTTSLNQVARGARILVVDDEEVNRQILYSQLQVQGYDVVLCGSGEEALSWLENEKPQLILLDLMMPQLNGFEVCEAIREQYNRFELPILMLTASHQVKDVVKALNIGANDYLFKPYHEVELLARMHSLISAGESHKHALDNKRLNSEISRRKDAQEKLRHSNQRLLNVLNNADDAILLLDNSCCVIYANQAACVLLEDDGCTIKDQSIEQILCPRLYQDLLTLAASRSQEDKQLYASNRTDSLGKSVALTVFASAFHVAGKRFINLCVQPAKLILNNQQKVQAMQSLSRELSMSRERIMSLEKVVVDIAVNAIGNTEAAPQAHVKDPRALLVNTLRLSIALWEQHTGKGKIELAEDSKIWRTHIDGSTVKTRTLDKYLSVKSLPQKPRWRSVIRTANFVVQQCPLNEADRKRIEQYVCSLEQDFLETVI